MFYDRTLISRSQALTSASNYRKIHANHSTKGVAAMAQNYTEQLRKDNVRDAIYEDLQNNCEVLRTSWSGNAFPANPKVGQPCYRVDEDKLYYWDGYKWSQKGGGGSAELKTMELAAATSERVSITLEGARCLDKNMMFVFVDKIAQDPSTYSMNDDGTVVNFNPAIPANAAVTLRWFDTDVGTFDTAIFASDAEFAAGELTNRAPNVKQVHSLSDQIQTSNANYVKEEFQSNLLNYTTNRILEIPQDIKLELNNGLLTLKAGSKVYVPNGFATDGTTPKFDVVTIESDKVVSLYEFTGYGLVVYNVNSEISDAPDINYFYSGTTPPNSGIFYNTTDNTIKHYSNGSVDLTGYCLPLAKIYNSSETVTSLDQIFNGFGYIGSTAFALPGVKYQFADGRNEDGTYKSITKTFDNVSLVSYGYHIQGTEMQPLSINDQGILARTYKYVIQNSQPALGDTVWYKPETNETFRSDGSGVFVKSRGIIIAHGISTNSAFNITSFKPLGVPTINSYQRAELARMGMPGDKYIDLTAGASGTTYVAPANGWFSAMNGNGKNGFCSLVNQTKKIGDTGPAAQGITDGISFVPVITGDAVVLRYSGKFNELNEGWFRFIYANGSQ